MKHRIHITSWAKGELSVQNVQDLDVVVPPGASIVVGIGVALLTADVYTPTGPMTRVWATNGNGLVEGVGRVIARELPGHVL